MGVQAARKNILKTRTFVLKMVDFERMFLYNEKKGGVNDGKAIRQSVERKKTN